MHVEAELISLRYFVVQEEAGSMINKLWLSRNWIRNWIDETIVIVHLEAELIELIA